MTVLLLLLWVQVDSETDSQSVSETDRQVVSQSVTRSPLFFPLCDADLFA